jgi:predicted NBD/HSP70 family sugar kinase
MKLTGAHRGWDRPAAMVGLREAFGPSLVMENDVDAAALAERALGHGREVDHFAFVHVGTGIGVGLVLGGQLLRGAHGVAGEIAFLPLSGGAGADEQEARKRPGGRADRDHPRRTPPIESCPAQRRPTAGTRPR